MIYSLAKPEPWNFHRSGVAPQAQRLWNGLLCLVTAHEGGGAPWEWINNRPAVVTGSQSWAAGPRGTSLYSGDIVTAAGGWNLGDVKLPGPEATVVIHKRKVDGTNRASSGFGLFTNTVSFSCGAHLPWSDGTIYWDFGGNSGDSRLSVGGLTFGDDVFCLNSGQRGMEIWQNGFLRASKTQHTTRSTSGDAMWLGNGNSGTPASLLADNAEFAFFAIWDYQLGANDCVALTRDPWSLIRYAPPRAKAGAAGGGGGGGSNSRLLVGVG